MRTSESEMSAPFTVTPYPTKTRTIFNDNEMSLAIDKIDAAVTSQARMKAKTTETKSRSRETNTVHMT